MREVNSCRFIYSLHHDRISSMLAIYFRCTGQFPPPTGPLAAVVEVMWMAAYCSAYSWKRPYRGFTGLFGTIPVSSRCHPGFIPVSSRCHPGVIPVSSRCHPGVIPASSRCHPGVIPASSRRHSVFITVSSRCRPGVIRVSSRCQPTYIPVPSQYND